MIIIKEAIGRRRRDNYTAGIKREAHGGTSGQRKLPKRMERARRTATRMDTVSYREIYRYREMMEGR